MKLYFLRDSLNDNIVETFLVANQDEARRVLKIRIQNFNEKKNSMALTLYADYILWELDLKDFPNFGRAVCVENVKSLMGLGVNNEQN